MHRAAGSTFLGMRESWTQGKTKGNRSLEGSEIIWNLKTLMAGCLKLSQAQSFFSEAVNQFRVGVRHAEKSALHGVDCDAA